MAEKSRYDYILSSMMDFFEQNAECIIDDASDVAIKFKVIAGELAKIYDKLEFYEKQIYPNTAEGEYLKRHGEAKGIFRKSSARASGEVTFRCKDIATSDIIIPVGTLCTSSKANNAMYRTTKELVIEEGSEYGFAPIESVEAGANTDIAPFYIDILVTPISGIASVSNSKKVSGGADEEADGLYRQRVIDSYSKISNGANLNYYEQFAKSKGDIWYAKAIFLPGTSTQIELYVENFTRTISDDAIALLQNEIEKVRELGIKVAVKRPVKKKIDLNVNVKIDNMANEMAYYLKIDKALEDQFLRFAIGQSFSPAILSSAVLPVSGVLDVNVTPSSTVVLLPNEICERGVLTLNLTS